MSQMSSNNISEKSQYGTAATNPGYDYKVEPNPYNQSGNLYGNIDLEAQNQNNQWGNMGTGLSDKIIRIKFIRKVYLIVSAQLIFTFGICLLFSAVDSIKKWMRESDDGLALYLLS
jgi:hypothetical protein